MTTTVIVVMVMLMKARQGGLGDELVEQTRLALDVKDGLDDRVQILARETLLRGRARRRLRGRR